MNIHSLYLIVLFIFPWSVHAQKTVHGLHFDACIGKEDVSPDFYKDKFLVIDFWATWCGPCLGSMPHLKELEDHCSKNGNVIFATMTSEPKEKVEAFLSRRKELFLTAYPLLDSAGQTWKYFNVVKIPRTLIFSPEGILVYDGHPKELTIELLDGILLGETPEIEEKPNREPDMTRSDLREIAEKHEYFACIAPTADTLNESGNYSSSDSLYFLLEGHATSVGDYINIIGDVSLARIQTNNPLLLAQKADCCFRLSKTAFPEFNKGIFPDQYRNHLLRLLERSFNFHASWKRQQVFAVYLETNNAGKLNNNRTISEYGQSSSWAGNRVVLVRYDLNELAYFLENVSVFNSPVLIGVSATDEKYDFILDCTNEETLRVSLAEYGLVISAPVKSKLKILQIDFSE